MEKFVEVRFLRDNGSYSNPYVYMTDKDLKYKDLVLVPAAGNISSSLSHLAMVITLFDELDDDDFTYYRRRIEYKSIIGKVKKLKGELGYEDKNGNFVNLDERLSKEYKNFTKPTWIQKLFKKKTKYEKV